MNINETQWKSMKNTEIYVWGKGLDTYDDGNKEVRALVTNGAREYNAGWAVPSQSKNAGGTLPSLKQKKRDWSGPLVKKTRLEWSPSFK